MHRIIVVPLPAPNKSVFFKNSHQLQRDAVHVNQIQVFAFFFPGFVVPLPVVGKTASKQHLILLTIFYFFFL
jgi:hypothetical protein